MKREVLDDVFSIQIRLFRLFQLKEKLNAAQTEKMFQQYDVFKYIEICYEEYHVQGDDANLADIYHYLENKGWKR